MFHFTKMKLILSHDKLKNVFFMFGNSHTRNVDGSLEFMFAMGKRSL